MAFVLDRFLDELHFAPVVPREEVEIFAGGKALENDLRWYP
jgi:hypothetical protein